MQRKRRQRIGVAVGLTAVALVALSGSRQHSSLRPTQHVSEGDKSHYQWSFFRRLEPLTEDEVNAIIFERHDQPYPEKTATYSPRPTVSPPPGTTRKPTAVPVPTTAPGSPSPTQVPTILTTEPPTSTSETVEEFLTRTLTDDGALQTTGTPQNLAFAAFQTSYPAITEVTSDSVREFVSTVYSLSVLFFSTGGDQWRDRTAWLGATPPCGVQGSTPWAGVSCTDSSIDSLSLPNNDLVGQLPSEIRGLPSLQSLNLAGNSLTGSLPPGITQLVNLTSLDLGENFLAGTIPVSIASLSQLTSLSLDTNLISGSIPLEVNQLSSLQVLELNGNSIDGTIPLLTLPSLGKPYEYLIFLCKKRQLLTFFFEQRIIQRC